MFRSTILFIIRQTWPMIMICSVIMISMRVVYIIKNKIPIHFYQEILKLGFVIYVMCLFYVVTFQDVSWSSSNFIPFKEMFRYQFGSSLFFKNVVGNMIMFLPYGFFVSYFLKLKRPLSIFILTFITSITIETTQLMIGRVFDVDDILLNLIGGFLGFYMYKILEKTKNALPDYLKKDWIYTILFIVLIFLLCAYLFNIITIRYRNTDFMFY